MTAALSREVTAARQPKENPVKPPNTLTLTGPLTPTEMEIMLLQILENLQAQDNSEFGRLVALLDEAHDEVTEILEEARPRPVDPRDGQRVYHVGAGREFSDFAEFARHMEAA